MSDERLKMPPERDFGFYQRRKHDKWRAVPTPALPTGARVADSHAHLHMLPDPMWELERCAANGVDFVCNIVDPSGDELQFDYAHPTVQVRNAVGVHPHNARLYDADMERMLVACLDDLRIAAIGEIGLDFHYDLSPRDVQRDVFRRQIEIAQERDLPIALHLRGGEDPERDDAHREAFAIMESVGAFGPRTLLHCCTLSPDQLRPWIDADCSIAYGGAVTFKGADAAREGARLVPDDRLLLETDSPYMAPEPVRGVACTPAHVIFTAAYFAAEGRDLDKVHDNALRFYNRERDTSPQGARAGHFTPGQKCPA